MSAPQTPGAGQPAASRVDEPLIDAGSLVASIAGLTGDDPEIVRRRMFRPAEEPRQPAILQLIRDVFSDQVPKNAFRSRDVVLRLPDDWTLSGREPNLARWISERGEPVQVRELGAVGPLGLTSLPTAEDDVALLARLIRGAPRGCALRPGFGLSGLLQLPAQLPGETRLLVLALIASGSSTQIQAIVSGNGVEEASGRAQELLATLEGGCSILEPAQIGRSERFVYARYHLSFELPFPYESATALDDGFVFSRPSIAADLTFSMCVCLHPEFPDAAKSVEAARKMLFTHLEWCGGTLIKGPADTQCLVAGRPAIRLHTTYFHPKLNLELVSLTALVPWEGLPLELSVMHPHGDELRAQGVFDRLVASLAAT